MTTNCEINHASIIYKRMKKVKIKLTVVKEMEVPDNCTKKDLIDNSSKIKKILDLGYQVEIDMEEIKD